MVRPHVSCQWFPVRKRDPFCLVAFPRPIITALYATLPTVRPRFRSTLPRSASSPRRVVAPRRLAPCCVRGAGEGRQHFRRRLAPARPSSASLAADRSDRRHRRTDGRHAPATPNRDTRPTTDSWESRLGPVSRVLETGFCEGVGRPLRRWPPCIGGTIDGRGLQGSWQSG